MEEVRSAATDHVAALREVLELGWPLVGAEDEIAALGWLMAERETWEKRHLQGVAERDRLRSEIVRLEAKLAEYDKYVGEFTRHA